MKKNAAITMALAVWSSPVTAGQERPDPGYQDVGRAMPAGGMEQWSLWRGPLGTGVAPHADPPITWSERSNIRWKTAIPGTGHSTPVIWGDRIFLTTGIPHGDTLAHEGRHAHGAHDNVPPSHRQKFDVLAVSRCDGAILWQRTVRDELPHESTHETGTWASNSPVTDGNHVFAFFGSRGLFCLDMEGVLQWEMDFGDMHTKHGHGEGSSPALYRDTLIVNWDHEGDSFVVALDKRTGKQLWNVPRDEGSSWSTPLIIEHDGKPQVIISASNRVRSYELSDGKLIWECGGLSGNVVASPVADGGFVYAANSYETQNLLAIRLAGARGDITGTDAVAWSKHQYTPYVPSPLLYGERLYFLKHYQGFLTCVAAKTGDVLFGPQRLEGIGNVFASLVGAANRVYIVDRGGSTLVLKDGPTFEPVALNHLDDSFSASPAIVGNELYLRGERFLYCITKDPVK